MIEGERGRSLRWSTTRPCSTIQASARRSRQRPSSRPQCAPHGGGRAQVAGLRESRRRILEAATRNGDAWSGGFARARRSGWSDSRSNFGPSGWPPRSDDREGADRPDRGSARAHAGGARELAHGLHPRVLAEAGLGGRFRRSPSRLRWRSRYWPLPQAAGGRRGGRVLRLLEALANISKHASASRVSISVTSDDERVRIAIEDDGRGGADPARGTGLRGLADRIEARGGNLSVESPTGAGTRLAAEIPLGGEEL